MRPEHASVRPAGSLSCQFAEVAGRVARVVAPGICNGFSLRENQSFSQAGVRKHGAEKRNRLAALNQQRREVLDIDITDEIGLVFDVDPDETFVWMAIGKPVEIGSVRFADITPGGAQACNNPSGFVGKREQLLAVVMIKSRSGHVGILTAYNKAGGAGAIVRHVKIAA